jgi:hypothetical protein
MTLHRADWKIPCDKKIMAIKAIWTICHDVSLRNAKNGIDELMGEDGLYHGAFGPEKVSLYPNSLLTFQEAIKVLEQWWRVEFTTR